MKGKMRMINILKEEINYQVRFVRSLKNCPNLKELYKENLADLASYRNALIQRLDYLINM